jgi:hypothetical protein
MEVPRHVGELTPPDDPTVLVLRDVSGPVVVLGIPRFVAVSRVVFTGRSPRVDDVADRDVCRSIGVMVGPDVRRGQ